ncbi:ABC transporter [Lasiodiplodia theobromae]|uniref:ZEB2-regulated ABC transporter 1 n=1 Tax=Lasiodiplodia theobromae TaxID=45133 RepID=A0A5N5DCK9_9PEZI|nr:ABC transporter [Lasiodiplodia theobromae]KAB2575415.1 ZEB2-regulated ABC transporter 1 [Lasiodiplodia theobromae]KAF4536767.1 ABC transporter [Lasiodiplodia theobromae]
MSSFMGAFGSNDGTEQRNGVPQQSTLTPQHLEQEEINLERASATTLATTRTRSQSRGRTAASNKPVEDEKHDSDSDSQQSEAERIRQVTSLARQYTNASRYSAIGKNPFTEAEPNSSLDPNGENFNARAWAKALLHIRSRDAEKFPERTAGIAYRGLNVFGYGNATDYQKSVGNVLIDIPGLVNQALGRGQRRIDILRDFDGLVEAGEMLVVLGPPGSGCSTLLKTISGETHGFNIDDSSYINYQGISAHDMHNHFRGEAIYTAEVDVHFPNMTVGDTLAFAARARAPRNTPGDVDHWTYARHMRDVVMAMYGISHTINTRVGNDFVRGVSGGERKRVSIAEATLSQAPLQCWDNSTRGLDSANAIEFCKTLRMQTDLMGCTACVAIYQAPQAAYDTFDKVAVLYEGRQIFFGRCDEAKQYFVDMGFDCPDRQTTADFLTSMTSPQERVVRPGWENRVPRTPDEFAARWKESQARAQLLKDIDEYDKKYAIGGEYLEKFKQSRQAQQSKHQRVKSPYTLSYAGQIRLCLWRGFQRLRGDPSLTITQIFGNTVMALILGSVFYNLPEDTSSFYRRGALLFFAVLFNAFGSALEILTLYAQRPIVEKHARYALYHPSAEAYASMLTDLPYKIGNAICFNLILYFMTNLRREPGAFFFFLLISFILTLVMSMMFRTIASVSRTLSQAMAPAAVLILALVIYTGFVIPTRYMLGWSRWINYLDPISYGFESLMINEFHNRNYTCSQFVPSNQLPGYENIGPLNMVCGTTGAQPGQGYVNGDAYINSSYEYYHSHKWRNLGIEFAFMIGLCAAYLAATEFISAKKSKGEVLVFRRGFVPATAKSDVESAPAGRAPVSEKTDNSAAIIQKQTAIFHWEDMCYDIKIKGEDRRILDHVDGWVKPGTLTALMGVSGAGKTTLLDVLATRVTMGVITGDAFVDGRQRDASFQRKTGYVQQQDLHLQTSTVREALNFSALLRQPAHVSREEKLAYVDEVIKLLDMEEYADAVVGVPGEGLNVEQRKRLTIGVELAAKPQLLLFLDEPTSGLDSQTSWAICDLMEKLTKNGQAILCTIHQPSAMLFQRFDRLLFLARGGRTVYFGEIGQNSKVLTNYFERNGAPPCPTEANPAEWMLEVIGAAPGSHTDIDWHQAWRNSPEYKSVKDELAQMKAELPQKSQPSSGNEQASFREFAAPFGLQLWEVTKRVFEQYWRTPSYIYSKLVLVIASGLFVGFSFFKAQNTQQGLQNQMFAIFMLMTIFGNLVQQIMPHFVTQRALYEVRERPSKTYSWKAFMLSQIVVELPWNSLAAVLLFFTWYYPIGLWRNAEPNDVTERGALMFLLIWAFLMFTSTFTDMVIAGIEAAETGGNIANLLFMLTLIFCGVLATKEALPGFWIFMYYLSPFTYLISGMLSTAVANAPASCASNEFLKFEPMANQTCQEYIQPYTELTGGGYMLNPDATTGCQFCSMDSTNSFLASVDIYWKDAWRNFGIMWVYVIFNVFAAIFIYWLARVPKKPSKKKQE